MPQSKLWEDIVDPNTGKHSLEEHTLKLIKETCKNGHHWKIISPSKREIECSKCGLGALFVVGIHEIKDGKILIKRSGVNVTPIETVD